MLRELPKKGLRAHKLNEMDRGKSQRQQQQQQARREAGTRSRELGSIVMVESICIKLCVEYRVGAGKPALADRPPKTRKPRQQSAATRPLGQSAESGTAYPQGRCDVQQRIRHTRFVRDRLIVGNIPILEFQVKRSRLSRSPEKRRKLSAGKNLSLGTPGPCEQTRAQSAAGSCG